MATGATVTPIVLPVLYLNVYGYRSDRTPRVLSKTDTSLLINWMNFMEVECPHCGGKVTVKGGGRPKGDYSVKNVLDAYRLCGSVRAAARKLEMPPGTVWHILKNEGVI